MFTRAPAVTILDAKGKHRYNREHLNDLDALLKTVSFGPYVVFTTFSLDFREHVANWYYGITHYGRVPSVLITAFDDRSIVECLILGFTCFNATTIIVNPSIPTQIVYGSTQYNKFTWGKALIIYELLMRDYVPIISDIDTFWFNDVARSLAGAAELKDADVVGMNNDNQNKPNTGNMLFKNNARTRKMAEAWVGMAIDVKERQFKESASQFHDQAGFWKLEGSAWLACGNATQCLSVRAQEKAAVWMHDWQGCPRSQEPCSGQLAYVHFFCTEAGPVHKRQMAIDSKFWFVGLDANEPHMIGATAVDLINSSHHYRFSEEATSKQISLPCANEYPPNWF